MPELLCGFSEAISNELDLKDLSFLVMFSLFCSLWTLLIQTQLTKSSENYRCMECERWRPSLLETKKKNKELSLL